MRPYIVKGKGGQKDISFGWIYFWTVFFSYWFCLVLNPSIPFKYTASVNTVFLIWFGVSILRRYIKDKKNNIY